MGGDHLKAAYVRGEGEVVLGNNKVARSCLAMFDFLLSRTLIVPCVSRKRAAGHLVPVVRRKVGVRSLQPQSHSL